MTPRQAQGRLGDEQGAADIKPRMSSPAAQKRLFRIGGLWSAARRGGPHSKAPRIGLGLGRSGRPCRHVITDDRACSARFRLNASFATKSSYALAETPKTFSHHSRAILLFSRGDRVILVSFIHSVSSTTGPPY